MLKKFARWILRAELDDKQFVINSLNGTIHTLAGDVAESELIIGNLARHLIVALQENARLVADAKVMREYYSPMEDEIERMHEDMVQLKDCNTLLQSHLNDAENRLSLIHNHVDELKYIAESIGNRSFPRI